VRRLHPLLQLLRVTRRSVAPVRARLSLLLQEPPQPRSRALPGNKAVAVVATICCHCAPIELARRCRPSPLRPLFSFSVLPPLRSSFLDPFLFFFRLVFAPSVAC